MEAIGAVAPPKTYESNFFYHDFAQFGKQHSRYKAILPSTALSQHCCEVYFISLTVGEHIMRLECQRLLKSPPLKLLVGSLSGNNRSTLLGYEESCCVVNDKRHEKKTMHRCRATKTIKNAVVKADINVKHTCGAARSWQCTISYAAFWWNAVPRVEHESEKTNSLKRCTFF